MGKLEGKVAVITGASKGIGEGIAKVYAKYGAKCVLAARGPKVLELAEQLRNEGYEATGVQVDVSDYKSVERIVETAEKTYGKIDVLVCNAGVCVLEDFLEDDTFENRDLHLDINVKGAWNVAKAVIPSMIANGGNNVDVSIVKTIQNADGTEVSKNEINQYVKEKLGLTEENNENTTLNKDYVNAVREGMKSVTSGESGTAYVRFKDFNIKVGGKTGSAEAGKDANGKDIVNAWFAAFAPYDDPEIAVVVMVENGGHGNYTAEAVRNIMAEYFGMNTQNVTEDMQAVSYTESIR